MTDGFKILNYIHLLKCHMSPKIEILGLDAKTFHIVYLSLMMAGFLEM